MLSIPQPAKHLENIGSVARDHLALERTFLAWLRTSLGLVSLGIAITQLFKIPELVMNPDDDPSYLHVEADQDQVADSFLLPGPGMQLQDLQKLGKPIGASFVALGIVVLLLGCFRFFRVQTLLIGGKFQPSRVEVSVTALLAGTLIIAALGVILGMRLGSSPS
ncbi:hypothetical protein K437DRAFT_236442 [Tilletiaria anomala UBC 951]|uniref:DUF202 domain-containing protein n=1 Tax=Tilletiaria anomala (strain ATCC 24038 / CBS 436.72 / UBC 951) TaxID=1037660 RepID=A0A066VS40_TILAU|nr:uncharacterized protein K437DRAFT_236442 [Tilletiaria anomala UBC 951]KDN44547.1 hypothetical protein K437DRAFT_236442 [Tilletiaria anomala UBC 951]